MRQKIGLIAVLLFMAVWAAGCGKDKELEEYKENMETFFTNISAYDDTINSIDPLSPDAADNLLAELDAMTEEFTWMAGLPVPEEFSGVEQLADDAAGYMGDAAQYYRQAFDSEPYDEEVGNTAKECYDRANKRMKYIIQLLHGEIPEDVNITYEDNTTFGTPSQEDEQEQGD